MSFPTQIDTDAPISGLRQIDSYDNQVWKGQHIFYISIHNQINKFVDMWVFQY